MYMEKNEQIYSVSCATTLVLTLKGGEGEVKQRKRQDDYLEYVKGYLMQLHVMLHLPSFLK